MFYFFIFSQDKVLEVKVLYFIYIVRTQLCVHYLIYSSWMRYASYTEVLNIILNFQLIHVQKKDYTGKAVKNKKLFSEI